MDTRQEYHGPDVRVKLFYRPRGGQGASGAMRTVNKPPAIMWYVKDWLCDPQLRQASFATRGMWMDFLMHIWLARESGRISGTVQSLARLIGASWGSPGSDMALFLSEARRYGFCDVIAADGAQDATDGAASLTLVCRRLSREDQTRAGARKRKRAQRARQAGADAGTDGELPGPPEEFSRHYAQTAREYLDSINAWCEKITALPAKQGKPFNVYQCVQYWAGRKGHPAAINLALRKLHNNWIGVRGPWEYMKKIMDVESGKFQEEDRLALHEAVRAEESRASLPENLKWLVAHLAA